MNKKFCILSISSLLMVFQCTSGLNLDQFPKPAFHPAPAVQNGVRLSVINTGHVISNENMYYDGGSFWESRRLDHSAILVEHPQATFLFDTGLGNLVDEQFSEMPWWIRMTMSYTKSESAASQLIKSGYDSKKIKFMILSHLHWDHASGIKDFPDVSVKIRQKEYEMATGEDGKPPAFIPSQYNIKKELWQFLKFTSEPYLNFKKSINLFGDYSVVLVQLNGHTNGSVGMFVTTKSGKQFFFTGDTTWVQEGFTKPASKHCLTQNIVDHNPDELNETIVSIHHLMKKYPDIIIVPAHDHKVLKSMSHFPEFID